ncbi:MAG: DUF3047 domain-containing protein [Deltaproteobacteria bacterium]|nr:DUF3047 domain-containing protein [Deltaproteobacteria bacterium]
MAYYAWRSNERFPVFVVRACLVLWTFLFAFFGVQQRYATAGDRAFLVLGFSRDAEEQAMPEGWEHISYFGIAENSFSLSRKEGTMILEVKSLNSASALLKRCDIDLDEYPVLTWRWRVNRSVGMAVERDSGRNDAAARIRAVFGKGTEKEPFKNVPELKKFFEGRGLVLPVLEPWGYKIDYIWATGLRPGEVVDYPGRGTHKMIALEQGNNRAGRWVWEERNLQEDFRRLFGMDSPRLSAVLVLSDTDQTNEGVEAAFSSIVMMKRAGKEEKSAGKQ